MNSVNRSTEMTHHDMMRSVEDDYWWYRALRSHVVRSVQPPCPTFDLLDAGCGTGGMLARLRQSFPDASLTGIDISDRGLELTARRETDAALLRASADCLPFPDASFDFVLSLDVLTFQGVDDAAAVREAHRVLRTGGRLLVNVAAFEFLKGRHDIAVNVDRRYTRKSLRKLLLGAGFSIRKLTYWNMTLMPAVALVRWISKIEKSPRDGDFDFGPLFPPLNSFLTAIAKLELAVSQAVALPFGTSVFAVAVK
jgi:ubiquinone/menaquinone biosynthesis C-methylase UbiE